MKVKEKRKPGESCLEVDLDCWRICIYPDWISRRPQCVHHTAFSAINCACNNNYKITQSKKHV